MVNLTLDDLMIEDYRLFLSGKNNFRYDVYPEYKANRLDKPRPKWEQALKQYLVDQWGALSINGMEGDDACGIHQDDTSIISSNDKDLNQIPGWHYNFVKKERYYVTKEEGIRFFFEQLINGDRVDNIIKPVDGLGKKKIDCLLFEKTPQEMLQIVTELYSNEEYLEMNAKCLWIWRKPNDYWRDWIT